MPLPSQRSARLSKSDEVAGRKSPRKTGVQEPDALPVNKRSTPRGTISVLSSSLKEDSHHDLGSDADDTKNMKKDKSKPKGVTSPTTPTGKRDNELLIPPTPTSAVRRSSRAPVPSSRFKDMEVDTTGRVRRRSAVSASASEESDLDQEPAKKRAKKASKSPKVDSSKENEVEEKVHLSLRTEGKKQETGTPKRTAKVTESKSKKVKEKEPTPVTKTVVLEMTEDEIHGDPVTKAEEEKIEGDSEDPFPQEAVPSAEVDDEGGNEPISVEEMIERSLQEGRIEKSDLERNMQEEKVDKSDLDNGLSEAKIEKSDLEKILQEGKIEKSDLETSEATDREEGMVDHVEAPKSLPSVKPEIPSEMGDQLVEEVTPNTSEQQVVPAPPSITIGGQQVTFTERDGETVAIVTIPPGTSEQDQVTQEPAVDSIPTVKGRPANQPLTDVLSVVPNSHGGHTLLMGKASQSVAAGTNPVELSVEARQFSSLIKPKPRVTTNPTKGHGRVIPRDEQVKSMFKPTAGKPSPLTPPTPVMTVSATQGTLKTGQTYSLLPPLQPMPTTEEPKPSTQGPATTKGNSKVIIVSQKPSEAAGKSPVSTLSLIQQPQTLPTGAGNSTVLQVKKAAGSVINAWDLQCVLKTLSGGQPPGVVHVSEEATADNGKGQHKEEGLETASAVEAESAEAKDTAAQPALAPESEKTETGPSAQTELLEQNQESGAEVEASDVAKTEGASKDTTQEEAGNTEASANTASDAAEEGEATLELETTVTTAPSETEAASETLPVESALYQALQALEPQAPVGQASGGMTEEDGKAALDKWKVTGETIKVVDNGIEYDVRIVSQEDVTEEIVGESDEGKHEQEAAGITLKEEPAELEDAVNGLEMQTSGTQTLYSSGDEKHSIQRMATVVDKDGQKKQVYYVSVFPGKGVLSKVKSNQGARLSQASWVLSENGMYCCGKCSYKTDRKANFYKHRRLHIGNKPHVCPVCQYKAGTSSNLKRHMGIHKDIREHKCEICGLCFRQKIHLERHIKYKHEEKSVKCPLCDYVCANEQPDLKMHMKRKHGNGKTSEVLTCPECHVEVGSKKDLKQHMKFHKDGPELKLFCKECSFVTDCQSRLRRHQAIHSKLKPFQCGVCNYRAAQKEHVLRHLRTQHKIEVKREVKKTWKSRKQPDQEDTKEKADFSSGDKIFACNHCTMRFAKLINLYKHLHTQHSDIMPPETSGNYYCVVCEFSTTTKKNLLVHMRRHNMTDQTPPTHVYSCVLCRYVNPKRRNLFQHMRKKHNIDISNLGEEETETQVLEMGDVMKSVKEGVLTTQAGTGVTTVIDSNGGESLAVVDMGDARTNPASDLGNLANMIKIEDLTKSGSASGEGNDGVTALVIDTTGESAQVVHTTAATSLLHHQQQHSVEALEGLQALAEQAGLIDNVIEEQVHVVPGLDEHASTQTVVIEQPAALEEGVATDGLVEVVSAGSQEVVEGQVETQVVEAEAVVAGMELTEDQLSSLRHGDMVDMDGELYLVELTHDPDQPDKHMLSFVPVSANAVAEEQPATV